MAENGVRTIDFSNVVAVDDVIGNYNGSTVRFSIGGLISLIGSRIGPSYASRSTLYSDLDWPDGAIGAVYGDSTESRIGVYKKTGNSGLGSWTRIGDLPINQATIAMLREKASVVDLGTEVDNRIAADKNLLSVVGGLSNGARRVGPDFDASTGAFPSSADHAGVTRGVLAGDTFRVSTPGTVSGKALSKNDTITAQKNAPSTSVFAGNWLIGDNSEILLSADIQPFLNEAEMLASTQVSAGQRAQVAGSEWVYLPLGTLPVGPTAKNGTILQAASTSLVVPGLFNEDTRSIEFMRSVYGSTGTITVKYDGFPARLNLSQVSPYNAETAGGVKIYIKPGERGFNPKAFGAKGDDAADDTLPLLAAAMAGPIYLPFGRYRHTETIFPKYGINGEGVTYGSPYVDSAITGAVFVPVGLPNGSAISILSNSAGFNKSSYGGFGIDMSNMDAGSNADDFALAAMTKGIYAENRHSLKLHDIEIVGIPTNAAGFVFKSVQPGGGMYWGDYERLAVRTKKAAGNDPTAKGFVLVGSGDEITAQEFHSCTSYRGWYLRKVNQSNFRSCHSEGAPKNSWLIDDCRNLLWEGGFHEGQGQEVADPENYYQFKGSNAPKRMTWINLSLSGNGITGFDKKDGHVKINTGGRIVGDQGLQEIGTLKVDEAGLVNMPSNSAFCGFLTSFNSTVPTATLQSIFFSSAPAGFDQAAEYNSGNGQYIFKNPGATFGGITATYRVSVHLKITKSGGGAITAGTEVYLDIGGSGYAGPSKIKAISSGQATMYLVGSLLVRLSAASASFLQPKFYHNNGSDLAINHASGAASDSWITIAKVT